MVNFEEGELEKAIRLATGFLSGGKKLRDDVIDYLALQGIEHPHRMIFRLLRNGAVINVIDDPNHDDADDDDDSDVITAADEPDLSGEGEYLALPGDA